MPSGIEGLDTILSGGFLKGGLYIIQGPPGTGKTTFGNQVCFRHVAAGGQAVYVTLLAEYHARMMQHLSIMTFFDASKIPDRLTYINGLSMLDESGFKHFLAMLRREVAARSASVLVLDGILSARRAAANEQTFNEFIHDLQAVAIASECTVFILASAGTTVNEPEHTVVDGIIQLADELTGWSAASLLQVIKLRGSGFLRGRHAFRITNDGIVVYPRIEELLARPSVTDGSVEARMSSGIDQLDLMLGGGLPEASSTMIAGPTGTGKTTLGLQFLAASNEQEPALLFSFYETPARINVKAAEVCPPLRGLIDDGIVEVMWQPPTDDLLDAFGDRLLRAVRRRKVRRLFIDGLGAFQQTAAGGAGRISMFLTALMNEMRVLGVTTVYTLDIPNVQGPGIRTSIGDLSILAENLVMLRFIEVGAQLHRLISVLKVRDSTFDQTMHEYTTSDHGLIIEPTSNSAHTIMLGHSRQPAGKIPAGARPQVGNGP